MIKYELTPMPRTSKIGLLFDYVCIKLHIYKFIKIKVERVDEMYS